MLKLHTHCIYFVEVNPLWYTQKTMTYAYIYSRKPQHIFIGPFNTCYTFRSFWPSSGIKYHVPDIWNSK